MSKKKKKTNSKKRTSNKLKDCDSKNNNSKTSLIITVIGGVIIYFFFYANPSIYDSCRGPNLDVRVYPDLKQMNDGKPSIVVDLHNTGGWDITGVEANLSYTCYWILSNGERASVMIHGDMNYPNPPYTLKKGDWNYLYFQDDTLTRLLESTTKDCNDAFLLVQELRKVNLSTSSIINSTLFEYSLAKDEVTKRQVYEKTTEFDFCIDCDIEVNVLSNEGSWRGYNKTNMGSIHVTLGRPSISGMPKPNISLIAIAFLWEGKTLIENNLTYTSKLCQEAKKDYVDLDCNDIAVVPIYLNRNETAVQ